MTNDLNHALTRARDLAQELAAHMTATMRQALDARNSVHAAEMVAILNSERELRRISEILAAIAPEATLPPIVVKEIVGKCPHCLGKGKPSIGCFVCGGLGIAKTGQTIEVNECPRCAGNGCDNHNNLCSLCGGTGISETVNPIVVKDVAEPVANALRTWLKAPLCRRCHAPMQRGQALANTLVSTDGHWVSLKKRAIIYFTHNENRLL